MRALLLGPGSEGERFHRCLVSAKRFIETTSVPDLLERLFGQTSNRRLVTEAVRSTLHVGFLVQGDELTLENMCAAATRAGFRAEHSTYASTVVARELGAMTGQGRIPTMIFMARAGEPMDGAGFVETFIALERKDLVRQWIENEIGTHVGLTLVNPSALSAVDDVFRTEGFHMPSFMKNTGVTDEEMDVLVSYYDRAFDGTITRVEVLSALQRHGQGGDRRNAEDGVPR